MTPATAATSRTAIYRDVVREISVNLAMAVPAIRRLRLSRPRNSSGSVDLLDRYAFYDLSKIERLVGPVRGRSVVEFGPGDHLAAGLSMLAAGASRYASIDRFVPDHSSPAAKRWYAGVHAAWVERFPDHRWPQDLCPDDFPEAYHDRVTTFSQGVEGNEVGRDGATYGIETSWQVGEHVRDIRSFADFGPHDCWRRYEDPLTFLHFAPPLWQAMSSDRGSPNRRRHHEFLAAFSAAGLAVTCCDARAFDAVVVDVKKLNASFRDMPPDSLDVRDVIYISRSSSGADR